MPWENLQLDILLDVAQYQDRVRKREFRDWLKVKTGADHSLVKRNRPEEMLDNLAGILAERPFGPWTVVELLTGLGWGDDRGARVSVGKAMKQLGWTSKDRQGGKRRTRNSKVNTCSVYVK